MQIEDRSLEQTDTATQPHWTACLAMLVSWLTRLFDHITRMKSVRRTTTFRANWKDNWPGLRQSEWLRDQTLAYGAAQLLSGKALTLDFTPILDPPAGYGGPCPQSPFEMNRRFLALAQWLADPESWILRHAQRIAKREGIDLANPLAAHGSTDARLHRAAHHELVGAARFALILSRPRSGRPSNDEREPRAQARAPPHSRGPPRPTADCQPPTASRPRQRERPRAPLCMRPDFVYSRVNPRRMSR